MTRAYILSKGAVADLRDITRYTMATWGEVQCRDYIAELEKTAEAVARGEGVFKDMGFLFPGLRMASSGKHYVFCMPQTEAPSVILAILHERMDPVPIPRNGRAGKGRTTFAADRTLRSSDHSTSDSEGSEGVSRTGGPCPCTARPIISRLGSIKPRCAHHCSGR